jgi:signal transduction histidine kinase
MQQLEQQAQPHQLAQLEPLVGTEQKRVDAVVETLTTLSDHGESLADVAHDARNMVTALDLYCDLLQEPGVLAGSFVHYGGELKLVAAASRRLVEKLAALDAHDLPGTNSSHTERDAIAIREAVRTHRRDAQSWQSVPASPIDNLAEELFGNRNLLAALAGPTIVLTVDAHGGARPVRLTGEDLTRILVNLVKNAAEAMSAVGRIHISLWESSGDPDNAPWLTMNIEDNGPGIADKILEKIFEPGSSAAEINRSPIAQSGWPAPHKGLGLSICHTIVERAGGRMHAANRDPVGACFQIELPVRKS